MATLSGERDPMMVLGRLILRHIWGVKYHELEEQESGPYAHADPYFSPGKHVF